MFHHYHSYSHYAYHPLLHEFGRSVVHGFGWGIGWQLARHLPFALLLLIVVLLGVGWMIMRRRY
ncbi:hypothetical protein Aaci_0617 [Alicyclobacillus acidocaldarius subsp. acidocaldarius DSM 446]|uniref:Uncharacterized protein n=1 Tax=Alicyclobacillus acidocaldarius subsp. acidocaldarius (strain ATCC 27009 / DSM 446 / BCRC 14685 / JCM 5260 / KCTC 1825 / NBRC 15652 / NCIMB 11725 / NRRL B-14509 / 104-IA) TaxID=521098 RepID=C8WTC3_ALIAD|nr:hypothetical protein Aaci_0617 [Alicyclobacillus acidocaldarius subsp. acidocaldarius DSM 446]